jgi:universal stress protein A
MFKRILVAVDYSPCSRAAFEQALGIAHMSGCVVDVVHALRAPEFIPPEFVVRGGKGDQTLTTLYRERAQEEMDALVSKAKQWTDRIGRAFVEDGEPAPLIVEHVKRGDYDLLVIGTHGRTGLKHFLLGSVAEKVVRMCPKPVMIVRLPD